MYKNILYVTDFESNHNEILSKAIKFAKDNHADLFIAHIQPINVPTFSSEIVSLNSTVKTLTKENKIHLEKFKSRALESGVSNVEVIIDDSVNVVNTITSEICVDKAIDLIICGSNNKHGLSNLFLGSISSGLCKHAHCDVFVVKKK